ncbi:hypothetical protein M5K25_005005 [Dendrobium thyrsiflorum]|uniref:Uncharacterized protein n=1 Tax=Dendrobium thyrsiflorum TaxID=117978 RepID=A0ABD0VGW6_DENTH
MQWARLEKEKLESYWYQPQKQISSMLHWRESMADDLMQRGASYLRNSSSSSEEPIAIAESQNFCIIEVVVSFPKPPALSTLINANKKIHVRESKKLEKTNLQKRVEWICNFAKGPLRRFQV